MRKFYLFVILVVLCNISFSAPVITASSSGYWNSAATWNLNRLPKVGDTIVIPGGKTVTIDDDQNFNGFIYLKVVGTLNFQKNNSTLSVDAPSVLIVNPGGQITGSGSPSQKIRYNNSIIFDGNDAAIVGPQMATAVSNGFAAFAFASSPLPVKFVGFTVTRKNADVFIQWSTSEEMNADMYHVERSLDGTNWNTIAYVAAVGNSSTLNHYSFTDKNVSAKVVYYRIKEVDVDGKTAYTAVKSIKSETASVAEIKIAGISNKVLLQFPQEIKGNILVRFVSKSGQVVDQQIINNPVGQVV
ncbi:MAG TPA: G8 domain-containing protein, partial [Flavisolibacter sp.]|nr:G8 domain-containing protein [Flavisolibacter sp.]